LIKNLFIVGAAKSGTTSLHNYLSQHDDICLSQPKEPKYFSYNAGIKAFKGPGDSKVLDNIVKTHEQYNSICISTKREVVYGESSADNLYYSSDVIPSIKQYNKDSKIIIMLRNPVDRALSAYSHLRRDGREELSLKQALDEESKRIKDGWEFIWHYQKAGFYFDDVKRYLDCFSNVKVIIYDDFVNDFECVMDSVYEFLGVKKVKVNNIRYNKSVIIRFSFINKIKNADSQFLSFFKKTLTFFLSEKQKKNLITHITNLNLKKDKTNKDAEIKFLKEVYKDDVAKLEILLNVNLASWK
jgi:hypothetical protein